MSSLTVFANFRIDSEERFLRMQDSFFSFHAADIAKWVINVRGQYKAEVTEFLKNNLDKNLDLFNLDSEKGWFYDSAKMLAHINTKYVFVWIEDHICMSGTTKLNALVNEMCACDVEYLDYTWFGNGAYLDEFGQIDKREHNVIYTLNYNRLAHKIRNKYAIDKLNQVHGIGFISLCSICNKPLFEKLITVRDPYWRRYPKKYPFDFEKESKDVQWLPIKMALPKYEIFACIDDNNRHPGSCLIDRGLYRKSDVRSIKDSRKSIVSLFGSFYKSSSWLNVIIDKKNALSVLKNINSLKRIVKQIPYQF